MVPPWMAAGAMFSQVLQGMIVRVFCLGTPGMVLQPRAIRLGPPGVKPLLLLVSCLGPLGILPLLVRVNRLGSLQMVLLGKRRHGEDHRQNRSRGKPLHGPNVTRSRAPL